MYVQKLQIFFRTVSVFNKLQCYEVLQEDSFKLCYTLATNTAFDIMLCVCIYVYVYVYVYICMDVRVYMCVYVYMYVDMYVYVHY